MTILFGVLLILLGAGAYLVTGRQSVTALIPAFFGVVLTGVGALAQAKPGIRMHIMHAAVLLGLLGFFGSIGGAIKLVKWLVGGEEPTRPPAVIVQAIMAAMMVAFVALCVKSFIDARKARKAALPA